MITIIGHYAFSINGFYLYALHVIRSFLPGKARTSYSAVGVCTLKLSSTARVPPIVMFANIERLCNSPGGWGSRNHSQGNAMATALVARPCPAHIPSTARAGGEELLNSCVHSAASLPRAIISTLPEHRHALT